MSLIKKRSVSSSGFLDFLFLIILLLILLLGFFKYFSLKNKKSSSSEVQTQPVLQEQPAVQPQLTIQPQPAVVIEPKPVTQGVKVKPIIRQVSRNPLLHSPTQKFIKSKQPVSPSSEKETLDPQVVQEGLNKFRDFKNKKVYASIARTFMNLGLTQEELTNLNDHQKDLLNKIVNIYLQKKSDDYEEVLRVSQLARPLMDEFKKEFNLPRKSEIERFRKPDSFSSLNHPRPTIELESVFESSTSDSDSKKFSDYLGTFFDVIGKIQDIALDGLKKGASLTLLTTPSLAF